MPGPDVVKVVMTPEVAREILARNKVPLKNPSPRFVARLAKAITEGRWAFNGDVIRLTDDGTGLIDGHHRLLACIEAGKPIETLLAFGTGAP